MPKPAPIYRDDVETYSADMCLPLSDAARAGQIRLQALVHGHYPGSRLPHGALPGLKTVGFWDAEHPQSWGLDWHRNEGIEITFLESGSLGFAVDDREYGLHADHLTVTRPWQRHRVGKPNVGVGRLHWLILDVGVRRPNQDWTWPEWIVLSPADQVELTNILRHNERAVWPATADLRRCFQAIGQAVETDRSGSSVSRVAVWTNEMLLLLLDLFRSQKISLDESLSGSLRTVELFLADLKAHSEHLSLDWTLPDMAKACGLGVTQFVQYVKKLTNMTPMQYLNDCRLDNAAQLLRDRPRESVTDVALTCGFTSSQYFATVFARRFGVTPRDYRAG
jgi:AraC family L-rhamnose operon regulatory protein RhaS